MVLETGQIPASCQESWFCNFCECVNKKAAESGGLDSLDFVGRVRRMIQNRPATYRMILPVFTLAQRCPSFLSSCSLPRLGKLMVEGRSDR